MNKPRAIKLLLVWILPALLLASTWAIFGSYYESNDDVAITQVIRGETALAPVTNLHLYLHGLAFVLATLYRLLPVVPWYGILLYLLLYISLVLVYQVLYGVLVRKVSLVSLAFCLILIYWFAWQQTALLMSYTRLPILLVGTAILYASSQQKRFWPLTISLAVVALGWSIRPSVAVLGLLVAVPGAWWLAGYRAVLPVASAGVLMAIATGIVALTNSPSEDTRRHIDVGNALYLDYAVYTPRPNTTTDSLGVMSVANWAFADSTLVNEQLYKQSFYLDKKLFLQHTLPRKAAATYYMLREHCPWLVLFSVVVSVWLVFQNPARAKEYWLTQLAFAMLLLALMGGMKLPLRLASPLLSVWSLCAVIYVAQWSPNTLRLKGAWRWGLCIIIVLYTAKTWRQSRIYYQRQVENEAYMSQVYAVAKHRTLVIGGVEAAYQYLSPFVTYELSDSPALTLMGWLTLEPSLVDIRQHLTGTRDFESSLLKLAANPSAIWMMQGSFVSYLQLYSQRHRPTSTTGLSFVELYSLSANPQFARIYQAKVVAR